MQPNCLVGWLGTTVAAILLALPLQAEPVWQGLAPLPDVHGYAGMFAGASGGVLLVAGGANFPDGPPWDGGRKVWSDRIYMLEREAGPWRLKGKLPRPAAYGISVTVDGGVLCIGGSDMERHHAECTWLEWKDGRLQSKEYPPLPGPLAEMTGGRVGKTIHVIGGTKQPNATQAERVHWMLDLTAEPKEWRRGEFPGAARILAVAAVRGNSLYVMSGAALAAGPDGKPVRTYLKDAWRYDPGQGWSEIAAMPRAALGAPSPALLDRQGDILICGGDDGTRIGFAPPEKHPGFSRSLLRYDVANHAWREDGVIPAGFAAPVTTATTIWRGVMVIPSGEVRPATRTPQVTAVDTRGQ